jgi:hypothetical protein
MWIGTARPYPDRVPTVSDLPQILSFCAADPAEGVLREEVVPGLEDCGASSGHAPRGAAGSGA